MSRCAEGSRGDEGQTEPSHLFHTGSTSASACVDSVAPCVGLRRAMPAPGRGCDAGDDVPIARDSLPPPPPFPLFLAEKITGYPSLPA
jgi:hypothetical protein